MKPHSHPTTSDPDEFNSNEGLNTLTHFLGFLLAVGGVPVLITLAVLWGTGRQVVTFSIFGAALLFTYMSSTLYHYVQPGNFKRFMRRMDHISIYLLIAGTYTPFLLVGLQGAWGWSLFGILWGLAVVGIFAKLGFGHRFNMISTVAYVSMGWIGLVAIVPLVHDLPTPALILVLTGGLSYTIGAVFYALEKLRFNHVIWHLFCLGGSVLQFIGVFYLLGR